MMVSTLATHGLGVIMSSGLLSIHDLLRLMQVNHDLRHKALHTPTVQTRIARYLSLRLCTSRPRHFDSLRSFLVTVTSNLKGVLLRRLTQRIQDVIDGMEAYTDKRITFWSDADTTNAIKNGIAGVQVLRRLNPSNEDTMRGINAKRCRTGCSR